MHFIGRCTLISQVAAPMLSRVTLLVNHPLSNKRTRLSSPLVFFSRFSQLCICFFACRTVNWLMMRMQRRVS